MMTNGCAVKFECLLAMRHANVPCVSVYVCYACNATYVYLVFVCVLEAARQLLPLMFSKTPIDVSLIPTDAQSPH